MVILKVLEVKLMVRVGEEELKIVIAAIIMEGLVSVELVIAIVGVFSSKLFV